MGSLDNPWIEEEKDNELASHYGYVALAIRKSIETGIKGRYLPPPIAVLEGAKEIFQHARQIAVNREKGMPYIDPILGDENKLLSRIFKRVEPDLKKGSLDRRINELSLALNGLSLSNFQINPKDANSLIRIFSEMFQMGEIHEYQKFMGYVGEEDGDSSPPGSPEYP